jgi:hypothetical protein
MVPLGVLVFVSEPESAASAGGMPQVVVEKAEKRNRRERSLSAVFVNWFGALIPLPSQKLPERYPLRNNTLFLKNRKLLAAHAMAIPSPSRWWFFERNPLRTRSIRLSLLRSRGLFQATVPFQSANNRPSRFVNTASDEGFASILNPKESISRFSCPFTSPSPYKDHIIVRHARPSGAWIRIRCPVG